MTRHSTITKRHDTAGDFEVEVFDAPDPRCVIVTAHSNGVRRWDGEHFFHALADHCTDSAVLLVDQNQPEQDGVSLNPFPVLVARVQSLIDAAKRFYPGVPIVVIGHSMGCAITTYLDLTGVSAVVFVAPAAGHQGEGLVKRYGPGIVHGQVVTTSVGAHKHITQAYYDSVKNLVWEDDYAKLLQRFSPVYAFESGDEEFVGDERLAHRELSFASYHIIEGAKHNLAGAPLADFLSRLDNILKALLPA